MSDSSGTTMLMPTLVRTPDQHEPMPLRTPLLKSSTETGLQVAGLQGLATDPGHLKTSHMGRPIVKCVKGVWQNFWRCGGLNPGPFTCKANALPLSYIPELMLDKPNSLPYLTALSVIFVKNLLPTARLELAIFGLGDRRLIH